MQELSISCMRFLFFSFMGNINRIANLSFIHFKPLLNWDQKVVSEPTLTVPGWEEGADITPRGSLSFNQPPVHLF